MKHSLLNTINSPEDLRNLPVSQLSTIAVELRQLLLKTVSATGGHLSSGLGAIELTIALHYVFDTPHDLIVWDVGHQTYPHKILTGRRDLMNTIRQTGGLSGFPKRDESDYDTFDTGHSSTSIGAALGMAIASRKQGVERKTIAVIGDGAMTAGMAFEALHHAGSLKEDLIVILNDNDMSISQNVGGLSEYMARALSSRFFVTMREGSKELLNTIPPVAEFAKLTEEHLKGAITPGTLFEELGFTYFGPFDGHNLDVIRRKLETLKTVKGPLLIHLKTTKGKGYANAELDPCAYHGVGKFDPKTGIRPSQQSSQSYTDVFSDWLCDQAAADKRLIGITPAMREGSGLVDFSNQYPDRYFDVAIAEQHAITLAAGMACEGLKPVVAIYSTFLQRGYDQLIHDVILQSLPVLFAIDRAGIVGPDGATHAGLYDLAFLRCLPGMIIMTPSNGDECRKMLSTGFQHNGPAAVRYPKGSASDNPINKTLETIEIGKGLVTRQGEKIAILVFGTLLHTVETAAADINASVVDMRFVKPLDKNLIREIAAQHNYLVTIEEGVLPGGAGSAVNEFILGERIPISVLNLGLDDVIIEQGDRSQLLSDAGLDKQGIVKQIREFTS